MGSMIKSEWSQDEVILGDLWVIMDDFWVIMDDFEEDGALLIYNETLVLTRGEQS